jgi:hypothetical protein
MMSQWKKSLKLIKYGYQFKTNVVCGVIFMLVGIFFLVMEDGQDMSFGCSVGVLYIVLAPWVMLQVLKGVLSCGIAAAAPKRRYMEIQMTDKCNFLIGTFSYVFLVMILGIKSFVVSNQVGELGVPALYGAATIMLMMIYVGIVYNFFAVGIILVTAGWIMISSGWIGKFGRLLANQIGVQGDLPAPVCILLGLMMVWLGVALSGLLRRALYKKPVSKFANGAMMRKQV